MELELRQLLRAARRWWWILLLVPLVAGGVAYRSASSMAPLYRAQATLRINLASPTGAQDLSSAVYAQNLAQTYQILATTRQVLEPVAAELGVPFGVEWLQDRVSASTVRDTQFLQVNVSDTDPARAATVANLVGQRFADYIEQEEIAASTTATETMRTRIAETDRQIADVEGQILNLEQPGRTDLETQQQLDTLRLRLNQLRTRYGNDLLTLQDLELSALGATTRVTMAIPAEPPGLPYAPRVRFYTFVAAFLGLLVAAGAVFLLEYLDRAVKVDTDVPALIGAPLLSVLGHLPKLRPGHDQLYMLDRPHSPVAEGVRLLRANLEFAAAAKEIAVLAVSSPGPGDGKSTVVANLGVTMAQAGFSVAIVDADLRRPTQHRIFETGNDRGLTTLLTHPDQDWRRVAHNSPVPGLTVISSGPLPPNPADLLSLERCRTLLAQVKQEVDIVLVDTPPMLAVSDPLVVATQTDGVILVCQADRTRVEVLEGAAHLLQQGGIRIVGLVLNQKRGRGASDYYAYYGSYYGPDTPGTGKSRTPRRKPDVPRDERAAEPTAT